MTTEDRKLLKQMGVESVTRCKMCEAHEVREEQQRHEIEYLSLWMQQAAKKATEMQFQRNIAFFAVGLVALIALVSAVWK